MKKKCMLIAWTNKTEKKIDFWNLWRKATELDRGWKFENIMHKRCPDIDFNFVYDQKGINYKELINNPFWGQVWAWFRCLRSTYKISTLKVNQRSGCDVDNIKYRVFRLDNTLSIPQIEQHKLDSCSMGYLSKTLQGSCYRYLNF